MTWDPEQYAKFADERGRPFHDLVEQVGAEAPRRVVDLGCGPGELTASLAWRWPGARIEGLDSSAEMIAKAGPLASDRLSFRVGDIESWTVPADADVIVSNAALQWVPTHRELLARWAASLPDGGWLAFQVPGHFSSPSHEAMRDLAADGRWPVAMDEVLLPDAVATPQEYALLLLDAGLVVQVWETTYVHRLRGPDPVLEWMRGTALRPVLAALSPDDAATFLGEFGERLRTAYPPTPHGTFFPFRRIFAVGRRP